MESFALRRLQSSFKERALGQPKSRDSSERPRLPMFPNIFTKFRMAFEVTDRSSNLNDQLANAAKVLGRSRDRRAVFAAIYNGKRRIKTQDDLRGATKLSNVRLLQESGRLVANQLVDP